MRFSGFLNIIAAGDYEFLVHSDAGFRLSIGDATVALFDGDRAPADSFSDVLALSEGLYKFELIGWEQGGAYVDEVSWRRPGFEPFAVVGTDQGGRALFTVVPLPRRWHCSGRHSVHWGDAASPAARAETQHISSNRPGCAPRSRSRSP